jgi:hypothetical protein
MRKIFVAVAVAGLMAGAAQAHQPEGAIWLAWQWPAGTEPTMDGDLSEWQIIPEDFVIDNNTPAPDGDPALIVSEGNTDQVTDLADFSLRFILAWSDRTNRIYGMVDRYDDVIDLEIGTDDSGCCGQLDTMELGLDADHSGGQYAGFDAEADFGGDAEAATRANGRQAQTFHVGWGRQDGKPWKWNWQHEINWDNDPPWSCCEDSFIMSGSHGTEGTTTAEIYLTPWDEFDHDGPANSVEHNLTEGAIIGFELAPVDMDIATGEDKGAKWTLRAPGDIWNQAGSFTDFLLMPVDESLVDATAVKRDSWGRIKASVAQ